MSLQNKVPKILLTGGNGFLGTHLLNNEVFKEALVVGRSPPSDCHNFITVSFDDTDNLASALCDIDVVVHVAARAHVMNEKIVNPLDEYRNINTLGTLNLAEQASLAGVKRFIFISTIKVLGEKTELGRPFTNLDPLNPQDPYSISKAEAEIGLKKIEKASSMDCIIIRPPLIYGKGVKGNFLNLLKLTALSVPLPVGAIKNKRALVSVENLVDLIATCVTHPSAKNKIFLVSDDRDLSTPELICMLSEAGGHKARIFRIPRIILYFFFKSIGKSSIYERLCGSMQVNIDYTKSQLDWIPPYKIEDSLVNCWSSAS